MDYSIYRVKSVNLFFCWNFKFINSFYRVNPFLFYCRIENWFYFRTENRLEKRVEPKILWMVKVIYKPNYVNWVQTVSHYN